MKVPVLSSLILLLGLWSQLPAIERPKALDDEQGKKEPVQRRVQDQPQDRDEAVEEAIPEAEAAAVAWLGVLSEPVDETLSIHLGIKAGVVLGYVAPDSPAEAAGLLQHDVITAVDGEEIADQDELREAIQAHQPGDEVALAVVSRGQKVERKVALGERPQAGPAVPRGGRGPLDLEIPDLGELDERLPDLRKRMEDLEKNFPGGKDLQGRLDKHMKRLEKQLRELDKDGGLELDLKFFEDLPKPDQRGFNFNFKASSTFKFFDDTGSVEMKMRDGSKEVVVRDKDGEVLFEGPWDTPQDKAAAPEEIRERIERMDNGNRFHFRLENLPEPEMEFPEEDKKELE